MVDVFISYKREERARCERIYRKLRALELDVWFDARQISGESFDEQIDAAVNAAKAVLVLWSPASVASHWVRSEAAIGLDRKVLVAAQIADCKLPAYFRLIHYEPLHDETFADHDPGWLKLLERIGSLTGRTSLAGYSRALGEAGDKLLGWVDQNPGDPLAGAMRARARRLQEPDVAEPTLPRRGEPTPKPVSRGSAPVSKPRPTSAHPLMVEIPPGRFFMGSPATEARWSRYKGEEEPRHLVRIDYRLAMGPNPVSVDDFAEFIADTGHDMGDNAQVWADGKWEDKKGYGWLNPGFAQAGDHPVTCVSWNDANAYLDWLNQRLSLTGGAGAYRLPSEAEWEYACRAGTQTPFSFGASISTDQANYDGNFAYGEGIVSGIYRKGTTGAAAFPPNAFRLHDMHGNVWEWCEDAWHESYVGAPADGSAWTNGDTSRWVVRGGSWYDGPRYLRSALRDGYTPDDRGDDLGFRLARTLLDPAS